MNISMRPAPAPITTTGLSGVARGGVPLWLPLPFLLTGAASAALAGALLPVVAPQALVAPGFPHVLALVHIVTLGWLTMIVMGATLQLAPVILVNSLRGATLARGQYPLYLIGVVALVTGFWTAQTPLLIAGGALVVAAVAHYAIIMGMTLAHAATHPLSARYLVASVSYLCVVVSLGLTAALNFQLGFLGASVNRLLLAHITLGVVGWLTCTLIGVSYTLVRMFALVHDHDDALGRWVFALLNGGILGLAVGFALDWPWLRAAGGVSLVVAVWLFGWDYLRMLRARKRKPLDITQRHALVAVGYLAVVIPAGVTLTLTGRASEPALVALALAALVGWLGQSMLGYLYKIVPFLVWQTRYAPLVGRQRVPLMRDLVSQRVARLSFFLINAALPLSVVCALMSWDVGLQVTSAGLGLGLALAAGDVIRVVAPRPAPRNVAAA